MRVVLLLGLVSGTVCVSGIVVITDCAFFYNGDVLHLFSLVGVVF